MQLPNSFGDSIDVVFDGRSNTETTVLFVHGFGSNKNETKNYFVDVAAALGREHRTVRFDFTGYGESGGEQKNVTILRQVGDLKAVLDYVRKNFTGKIFIFAHSMGSLVTSLLCPDGIKGAIFTGIPNPDLDVHRRNLEKAILSRPGGVLKPDGISIYPRSSGAVQKIGSDYWPALKTVNPLESMRSFNHKTKLTIIHSLRDEIVGDEGMEAYMNMGAYMFLEQPGDHNLTVPNERRMLIELATGIFSLLSR